MLPPKLERIWPHEMSALKHARTFHVLLEAREISGQNKNPACCLGSQHASCPLYPQKRTSESRDQGRGMRATGGAANPPARCCSKSHRICQIRPSMKLIPIATPISTTINSSKVIGIFLSNYVPKHRPS